MDVDNVRIHPLGDFGLIDKIRDGPPGHGIIGGGEENELIRMKCGPKIVFSGVDAAALEHPAYFSVGRKIFESVPRLRMGFQGKYPAVDPESMDPVTTAELQCPVKGIGIGHTDFGKVGQLPTAGKLPQIFCGGSPEFYGFFPEYATES